uniref:Glycosyltransferase n=1 Tax=candidate division WOR-3 bacterium TaxID=2052148 RepID=A0A7C4TCI5_UNCW3
MKKIAILISSRKGGHKFPAEAVSSYISKNYPQVKTKIYNLLDILPLADFLDKLGRWGDLHLPLLWRSGYSGLAQGNRTHSMIFKYFITSIFANKNSERRIRNAIGRVNLILSFQPEVNAIGSYLKKWLGVPLHTMVMDYSSHIGWADDSVDYYYVVNEIVYNQLINFGVPKDRIEITGAPPQQGFENVLKTTVSDQRRKLNLKEDMRTVLIMAGYLGRMVDYEGIIRTLLECKKKLQIMVVVGRNYPLYKKLKELNLPDLYPFYNVPVIHDVMWAADIIISKPGGMVIADALSLGKPLILIDPKAGSLQEIIFADFIEKQGAGIHLKSVQELKGTIERLYEEPQLLKSLSETSLKLGLRNRRASSIIGKRVVETVFNL